MMLQKASQWVASAFGDCDDAFTQSTHYKPKPSQPKALSSVSDTKKVGKRSFQDMTAAGNPWQHKKTVARRSNKAPETSLWSEKYTPTDQSELAVHKKKIGEVEQWIQAHLHNKKLPPILLLTGPAGVGKTATIRVLAKQYQCEIHEWTNPFTADYGDGSFNSQDWKYRSRVEMGVSGSQVSQFQEFLLRANKYNTLDIFGGGIATRRIVMVEDFPNMFYRDPTPFHDILRKYVRVGGSPLIFIISDSTNGESNERLLFPKDLQASLNIENISFNPVAMTSLTKILTKVATEESLKGSHKFTVPSKSVIESIAMASAGDIRGAINALQFACLKDTSDLNMTAAAIQGKPKLTKTSSKRPSKSLNKSRSFQKNDDLLSIGGKDTSLFLFRALGKILYCKRDEPTKEPETSLLPKHLSHCYRDPLQIAPEEIVERCHVSGDFFCAYLHQNYLDFFTSIDDVVSSSEYLSDADYLTIDWASRSALQQYAASVATRGIMFSNSARAKHTDGGGGLGWRPLHKPQWYTACRQSRQNCENARYLFRMCRSAPVVLQTEIIPYMSIINTTLHDTGQIRLMQELCRFSKAARYEKLDEKDVDVSLEDNDSIQTFPQSAASDDVTNDVTDDVITNSQSNVKSSQEVEDYEIEDYDD